MADSKAIIAEAYSAFNRRDIDGALSLMAADVSWPQGLRGRQDYRKRRRSARTGLDSGVSSIRMLNR